MKWLLPIALAATTVMGVAIVFTRTSLDAPVEILELRSADDGTRPPVIIVTKSEVTYQGQLVGKTRSVRSGNDLGSDAPPTRPIRCGSVIQKLQQAVASVEPALAVIASTKAPVILSSCIYEGWPEPLKECIVMTSAADIAAHHCDALVPDELAQKLLDRLAPGQHLAPRDFLQR